MAICSKIFCSGCKQTKHVYHSPSSFPPPICDACKQNKADMERSVWLDNQARRPLEERLRAIEEFMYDHQRVEHGYQEPPRF